MAIEMQVLHIFPRVVSRFRITPISALAAVAFDGAMQNLINKTKSNNTNRGFCIATNSKDSGVKYV